MQVERRPRSYVAREIFEDFHRRNERFACMVIHRRGGKTTACLNDLIEAATGNLLPYQIPIFREKPHPLRLAYIAPLYKQAKTVAWDFLKRYSEEFPGIKISETELSVEFPSLDCKKSGINTQGGKVTLYGADNPNSLRGIWLDGVVLDEVADMSPGIKEVISPTLGDHMGFEVSIGTPRGMNDFYDLCFGSKEKLGAKDNPEWFFRMWRASETGLLRPEFLASERQRLTKEMYAQEYECSFQAAIPGAYYADELDEAQAEGRIRPNTYDPTLEVHTAWDLGHSNATAIWFYQQAGMEIRIVDFYISNKQDLAHYVTVLRQRGRDLGRNEHGYLYGRHYLPHDVEVVELGSGRSRLTTLRHLGLDNVQPVPKLSVDDGINAVRTILPRCWFDSIKCVDGLKALRQYHREWQDDRKVFLERPHHDWASDPADAFRYLAIGLRPPTTTRRQDGRRRQKPRQSYA